MVMPARRPMRFSDVAPEYRRVETAGGVHVLIPRDPDHDRWPDSGLSTEALAVQRAARRRVGALASQYRHVPADGASTHPDMVCVPLRAWDMAMAECVPGDWTVPAA